MKKLKLDPLELDKQTMAKLDEQQLQEIVGGSVEMLFATSGNGIATYNRRLFYAAIFSFSNSISSICLGVLYPRAECVLLVL